MTTSDVLKSTWVALSAESDQLPGIYQRRVFAQSGLALFVGLVRPSMLLRLTVDIVSNISTEGLERETKGYKVYRQYLPSEKCTKVHLELATSTFHELFEVVAADIVDNMLTVPVERSAITAMRTRLDHWQKFMQSAGLGGLTREDQIGLFGELCFLDTLLKAAVSADVALKAWKGPSSANQDFHINGNAVEVKATTSNSSTRVHISNELQLDETGLVSLHIMHIWLQVQEGHGLTLPQLVGKIFAGLPEAQAETFRDRLIQAGYHEIHQKLYEVSCYVERARQFYKVEGSFPRICKNDLRAGVAEVEYIIDLAGFGTFEKSADHVIRMFSGEHP